MYYLAPLEEHEVKSSMYGVDRTLNCRDVLFHGVSSPQSIPRAPILGLATSSAMSSAKLATQPSSAIHLPHLLFRQAPANRAFQVRALVRRQSYS